jgi:hypothetical protein
VNIVPDEECDFDINEFARGIGLERGDDRIQNVLHARKLNAAIGTLHTRKEEKQEERSESSPSTGSLAMRERVHTM